MKRQPVTSPLSSLRGLLVGLGLLLAPVSGAEPVALAPRAPADKAKPLALPDDTRVERIVVKFHEGTRVRLRGGRLVALETERDAREKAHLTRRGLTQRQLAKDLEAVQAPALSRHFQQDEATLAAQRREGEARSGRELADLDLYFTLSVPAGTRFADARARVEALNALPSVELAYAEPAPEPAMVNFGMEPLLASLLAAADLPPTTPSFQGEQGYLGAAPTGINALHAWGVPGGNGAGVRVVDIEGGWRTTHEDMPGLFHQGGVQFNDLGWRNHGTAVLGEIVGVNNGYGVTGIAHAAAAGVESIGSQSTASAITQAAAAVGRGGVILIELHAQGPADSTPCTCNHGQCNYIAMEYWQANFDAIAAATANGVVVVEAAGNGSANLDEGVYGNAFNRNVRDSGAIIVGASTSTTRVPMCWTNFGSRVDVHGWGENVVTMGYADRFNPGSEDQWYTSFFSGTSSASPIVTGAAASIQGAQLASNQPLLDSRAMRALLASTGTPQAADSRNIGTLPDLARALTRWSWAPQFAPPHHIAAIGHGDLGVRLVDLNGDGRDDLAYHRWINGSTQAGALLNTGGGWQWAPQFTPPFHIAADGYGDLGARFADLNADGRADLVFHRFISDSFQQKGAYLNTGNGWQWAPEFTPPYRIAVEGAGDQGARFADVNGDGRDDLLFHLWTNGVVQAGAWLNTGSGWQSAPQLAPPYHLAAVGYGDLGARFVDLNGDGRDDLAYHRVINATTQQLGAYLSTGNGWQWAPQFTPPFHIAADGYGDLGARFADLNADGRADLAFHRFISPSVQQKGAYLNTGNGWQWAPQFTPPYRIAVEGAGDQGARFADMDGDGRDDLVFHLWNEGVSNTGAYLVR